MSNIHLVDNPYETKKNGIILLNDRYGVHDGKLIKRIGGAMPTGTGAINERNLPNAQYEVNPGLFMAYTQRQVFNPTSFSAPAPAQFFTKTLRQVGIVARIRLQILGSVKISGADSTTTVTPTFKWPYGIFNNVLLSGNQQNNFIAASGLDLHIRKLTQLRAFVDGYTVPGIASTGLSGTASNGTFPFKIILDIPVAMDMTTLVGALYAQSEATNLTLTVFTEAIANLFTTGGTAPTISLLDTAGDAASFPTVNLEETIFSIPYHPQKSGTLLIPDLTVLHGLVANNNPVASQSQVTTELYRSNANLERLFYYTDNNNVLVPTANYSTGSALVYGASEQPYGWNPQDFKRAEDNANNRIILTDGIYVLDLTADNPARDQVILEGVTNLRVLTNYVAGQPSSASAKVHWVQETLFA